MKNRSQQTGNRNSKSLARILTQDFPLLPLRRLTKFFLRRSTNFTEIGGSTFVSVFFNEYIGSVGEVISETKI